MEDHSNADCNHPDGIQAMPVKPATQNDLPAGDPFSGDPLI